MRTLKIEEELKVSSREMRETYAQTLIKLAKKDEKVVALEADLMGAISMAKFQKEFPDRTINCGIMEAHMIGTACGLNLVGLKPFVHTFGPFATRRCFDQIFLSGAYAGLDLKIIGSDSGVTAEHNGGTHMPFEDVGLMRTIPNATVMDISDDVLFEDILSQIADMKGVFYIRIMRKNPVKIYQEGTTFEIGKGMLLKDGVDATIIANGILVSEALEAREILLEKGINVAVVDMFTIKPIDSELVIEYAKKTGAIVTAENHNITGGLGSAVAEVLSENCPTPLKRVGVNEKFGQVGTADYLKKVYNLTKDDIVKAVTNVLECKK